MNKEILGVISLLVTLVQYTPYCRSIYRKQLRPHVFSYLIWGVSAGIVAVAQWSADAGPGAWAMALVALLCFLVVGLSYRTGTRYISKGDWIAFIAAMLAIPIWVLTDSPLAAVVVVTLIDIAAFYMTLRKAIVAPNEESIRFYVLATLQYVLSILAIESYNPTTLLNPLVLTLTSSLLIGIMAWLRLRSAPCH
ncbi:hypothetical protein [Metapseudomonas resinovorans]|nr:hypothetical protein [Pseudomonas resinovorans]